jgi:hypothetical protein
MMTFYTFYVTQEILESCCMSAEADSEDEARAKVANELDEDLPRDWDREQYIEDSTELYLSGVTSQTPVEQP